MKPRSIEHLRDIQHKFVTDSHLQEVDRRIDQLHGWTPGGSGEGGIRRAFVKTPPSSGTSVVCHLDADETGKEITVQCDIYSYSGTGTFASDVRPTMIDGRMLKVYKKDGAWRNATDIHVVEAC